MRAAVRAGAAAPPSWAQVSISPVTRPRSAAGNHRDSTREDSPLTRDPSYTFVDASDLTVEEVVERMAQAILTNSLHRLEDSHGRPV